MFDKARGAAIRQAPGSFTQDTDKISTFLIPDWVWDWPKELGEDIVADLLTLHENLLSTASSTAHNELYLRAAAKIKHLTRQHTRPNLHLLDLDLRPQTQLAVTEIISALRRETADLPVRAAFPMASAWSDHIDLRISAAEAEVAMERRKARNRERANDPLRS